MISIAATPVAGRAGGHASSSRRAQAANALSSARSAAVSGGDAIAVLVLVVLVVTGARDQRRRLRSAALDIMMGRSDSMPLRTCAERNPCEHYGPVNSGHFAS